MIKETTNLKANYSPLCRLKPAVADEVTMRVTEQMHGRCPGWYTDWTDGSRWACQCPHHAGEPDTITIAL